MYLVFVYGIQPEQYISYWGAFFRQAVPALVAEAKVALVDPGGSAGGGDGTGSGAVNTEAAAAAAAARRWRMQEAALLWWVYESFLSGEGSGGSEFWTLFFF